MLEAASESSRPSASARDAQRESLGQVFPNREDYREGRDEGESSRSVKLVPIDWFVRTRVLPSSDPDTHSRGQAFRPNEKIRHEELVPDENKGEDGRRRDSGYDERNGDLQECLPLRRARNFGGLVDTSRNIREVAANQPDNDRHIDYEVCQRPSEVRIP